MCDEHGGEFGIGKQSCGLSCEHSKITYSLSSNVVKYLITQEKKKTNKEKITQPGQNGRTS